MSLSGSKLEAGFRRARGLSPVCLVVVTLLFAVSSPAQQPTPLVDPEVRRIGEQLRCMCEGCSYTVTSCNMLSCKGAEYGRAKLLRLVQQGLNEEQIKADFVKEFGTIVLTKPPSTGFNLLGWVMPFVVLLAGLLLVWFVLKRFLRKPATVPAVDDEILSRYQGRIDQDLKTLE